MRSASYSLNNLTLAMALTISTSFVVVDDAIVMIENIMRYVEEGKTPLEAALAGASQIGFTILSLTVSLIAVLIPLLFMGDIVGRLFREFAVTLSVTILVSAVVSLTLTPMMASRLLKHRPEAQQGKLYQRVRARVRAHIIAAYGRTPRNGCSSVIGRPRSSWRRSRLRDDGVDLYLVIPKGFFPVQDTGVIVGISEAPQIRVVHLDGRPAAAAVPSVIVKITAVESLSSFIGVDGTNKTVNSGRIQINLKPLVDRDADASAVFRRLQPSPGPGRGHHALHAAGPGHHRRRPGEPHAVSVQPGRRRTPKELASVGRHLHGRSSRELPDLLRDVASDQQDLRTARARLVIDRGTASRLGITPQMIDDTLYDAFGQRQVSTMFTQVNQYHVILETSPALGQTPEQRSDYDYVRRPPQGGRAAPRCAPHAVAA